MIIALTGKIGSGKSTVAELMVYPPEAECVRNFEYKFREETFAGPLKNIAFTILGFDWKDVYGTQEDKNKINEFWGVSGRTFLQKFGTEVCREALTREIPEMNLNGRSLWCRIMEKKLIIQQEISKLSSEEKESYEGRLNLVISDLRFKDEYDLVKQYNGIVVKIVRDCKENTLTHKSEEELDTLTPDYVIENNGTFDDLIKKVKDLLTVLGV
jgi:hypothetical protein